MTLLYLTHSCPYPPHKGDRIRSFHILQYLAERHSVKLIYPSFTKDDVGYAEDLRKYCTDVQTISMNSLWIKMRFCLGLLSRYPLTVCYFYSRKLQKLVDGQDFDAVLVDCSSMAHYVIDIDKPKIIDFVDVDYDKWRMYAERAVFPLSLVYNIEYHRLQKYEIEMSTFFDVSLVITENERKLLPAYSHVAVIPNGIDCQFYAPCQASTNHTLIFSGAMNYFANIDGVTYFCDEVFSLIQDEIEDVHFIIAGMHPVKKIQNMANNDVTVTGYVPDIRDYIARACVCVVPLRIAKGIQNKILEAMAMEVPVVATSIANQGINAENHKEIMIADSPQEFAHATVTLLRNERLRKEITINAKKFIQRHFNWKTYLRKLDTLITDLTRH